MNIRYVLDTDRNLIQQINIRVFLLKKNLLLDMAPTRADTGRILPEIIGICRWFKT